MNLTRILDTLRDADGNPARGRMVIRNPAFLAADGTAVAAGNLLYPIPEDDPQTPENEAGVVDLRLAPTEGADPPGVRYEVQYFLANGAKYRETWNVPLAGPITISQARGTA